jgi:probable HAF family extracellular repeat protein
MTDLGTLGGTGSQGTGVNASGQVTGYSDTFGNAAQHAFLATGGVMTDLGTLGGTWSYGNGVNASGQVTGSSYISGNGAYHAFLAIGGVMTDLNDLIDPLSGWTLLQGSGINDAGQITGEAVDGSGISHAFLLTPLAGAGAVPEPATWATMLCGLFGAGAALRRRRRVTAVAA